MSAYYASNEQFVSSAPTPTAKTNYYWQIGTLKAGQTSEIQATMKHIAPDPSAEIATEACATADGAADACADTSVLVSQPPSSSPPDSSGDGSQSAGDPITTPPVTNPVTTPPVTNPVTTPTPTSSPVIVPPPAPKEYGIWFWESPYAMTWSQSQHLIDQAKANGFNAIYITVDDYLDASAITNPPQRAQALQAYNAAVSQFITYANQQGIAVDAEAGWRDWGEPANRNKGYMILDFVTQYNATHNAKFRDTQYDVEPYLLSNYATNKAQILTDYVGFADGLVSRNVSGGGIELVAPYFYGTGMGWTPTITYGGKTDSTFNLLLSILDKKPGNSMFIMAYRNHAEGVNGTLDVASDEMSEASAAPHQTKLIVAQETGNVQPSYVTFYGMTRTQLGAQVLAVDAAYANSSVFNGIAIDYIDPYLAMPQ
jgi:hypothetical protein